MWQNNDKLCLVWR